MPGYIKSEFNALSLGLGCSAMMQSPEDLYRTPNFGPDIVPRFPQFASHTRIPDLPP
jgi:hypothetical protein